MKGFSQGRYFRTGPIAYRYDQTNGLSTNLIRLATVTGVGRWVHNWDGEIDIFGFVPGSRSAAADNLIALHSADASAIETGCDLILPPGDCFISGTWTNNHHRIRGYHGRGYGLNRTRLLSLSTNGPVMYCNATFNPTVKSLALGHDYVGFNEGYGDGLVFSGVCVNPVLEDLEIVFCGESIKFVLGCYDGLFQDINIMYSKEYGFNQGLGTQNSFKNIRFLNSPPFLGITGSSAEGSTNVILSSGGGSLITVGDWISLPSSGVWRWRRVTSKSGDSIGLNAPAPRTSTDSSVLGAWASKACFYATTGSSADSYGNTFELINTEWGRYGTLIKGSAEPYYHFSVRGLHIEGWIPYHINGGGIGPGANYSLVFDSGDRSSVNAEMVNILNTTLDNSACDGVSIVSEKASLRLRGLSIYEVDATDPPSTPALRIRPAQVTSQKWLQHVEILDVKDRTGGIWFPEERHNKAYRRGTWSVDGYSVRREIGSPSFQNSLPRIVRYGQGTAIPDGLWVFGDRFENLYVDNATYSNTVFYAVANWMTSPAMTGSIIVTNGRNWAIPDTNALSSLVIGAPISPGGTGSVRVATFIPSSGLYSSTLAQDVSATDRTIFVNSYVGYSKGDWLVIDPFGSPTLFQGQVPANVGSSNVIRVAKEIGSAYSSGTPIFNVVVTDGNFNLSGTYSLTNSIYTTSGSRRVQTTNP